MTLMLQPAVGLLERAVGYTRGTLAHVDTTRLGDPTPCRGWDLGRLLLHMDDALGAFTEASEGVVDLVPVTAEGPVLERIRSRACTLLGAWAELPDPLETVEVGDVRLPTDLLVSAGALEIAVHGWDVGQATGHPVPLPDDLARRLLPVAHVLVAPEDRPGRFGPALVPSGPASYADRLLGFVGRHP